MQSTLIDIMKILMISGALLFAAAIKMAAINEMRREFSHVPGVLPPAKFDWQTVAPSVLILGVFAWLLFWPSPQERRVSDNGNMFSNYEGWWASSEAACSDAKWSQQIAIGRFHIDSANRPRMRSDIAFGEGMEMIASTKDVCLISDREPTTAGFAFTTHCLRPKSTRKGSGWFRIQSPDTILFSVGGGRDPIGDAKRTFIRCAPANGQSGPK